MGKHEFDYLPVGGFHGGARNLIKGVQTYIVKSPQWMDAPIKTNYIILVCHFSS